MNQKSSVVQMLRSVQQGLTSDSFEIDQNAGGPSGQVLEGSAAADELEGGAGADQILGGAGDDRLNGGAGADIILDGAGSDRMWGGAGADIFVLSGDGENDFIEDFEIGVDRIDMSDMGRFYSFEALTFESKNYGAIIGFGGETLTIKTMGKVRLEAEDFQYADLFDLGHISIDVLSDEQLLPASPGPSVLTGGTELIAVRNHLGMDLHIGGAVDPLQDAAAASIYRLYQATLDRAPDRDGHRNWTEALLDGRLDLEAAARGFVGSREFQNVYGDLTDYSFVTQLYNNVLDRAPDQAGLENWMGALTNGFSRAQVVMGFSESREFVNATFQRRMSLVERGIGASGPMMSFGCIARRLTEHLMRRGCTIGQIGSQGGSRSRRPQPTLWPVPSFKKPTATCLTQSLSPYCTTTCWSVPLTKAVLRIGRGLSQAGCRGAMLSRGLPRVLSLGLRPRRM